MAPALAPRHADVRWRVPIGFAVGGLLTSQLVRFFGWPAIFVALAALGHSLWQPAARSLAAGGSTAPGRRYTATNRRVTLIPVRTYTDYTASLWRSISPQPAWGVFQWPVVDASHLAQRRAQTHSWAIFATTMYARYVM